MTERFCKNVSCIGCNSIVKRFVRGVSDKLNIDTKLGQRNVEQVVRTAVQRRSRNNVITCTSDVHNGEGAGSLSRCQSQCTDATFQSRDALFKHVCRWIHKPCINIAWLLQTKQFRCMLCILKYKRCSLMDGHRAG